MPDLEKQIAEWRRQMLAAGIKTPQPLDELESHLREEVAKQTASGLSDREAFEISTRRMGQPEVLKREFQKIERAPMRKIGAFAALTGAVIILRILTEQPDAAHLRPNEQVRWLFVGGTIGLFGLGNLVFNSNPRDAGDMRRWKLVGIAYSMMAVGISLLPIYLFLTEPRFSAAVGITGRIFTFAALALSILSVFAWRLSRRILPVIAAKRTRTIIGIVGCLLGPVLAALFGFSMARQLPFSIGVILITWTWTLAAILGGAGYGLTEAWHRQTGAARS